MTWHASVLTLFPEMFPGPLGLSLAGRALREGRWRLDARDIRAHATDRHRTVDDAPFGGGAGMVMRPDVVDAAIGAALAEGPERPLIYLTPRGRLLDQALARELADGPGCVLLCGRYEGVDQRVVEARGMMEVSVGDYVLSGGEPAALVLLDACVRLLPGVMGAAASAEEESHSAGLLEYPHYTRPAEWQGRAVPEVLASGHHAEVARWRREQAERITRERRPDLWRRHEEESLRRPEPGAGAPCGEESLHRPEPGADAPCGEELSRWPEPGADAPCGTAVGLHGAAPAA
jgi:tRNA (guanine37-N1)-methyltransferase